MMPEERHWQVRRPVPCLRCRVIDRRRLKEPGVPLTAGHKDLARRQASGGVEEAAAIGSRHEATPSTARVEDGGASGTVRPLPREQGPTICESCNSPRRDADGERNHGTPASRDHVVDRAESPDAVNDEDPPVGEGQGGAVGEVLRAGRGIAPLIASRIVDLHVSHVARDRALPRIPSRDEDPAVGKEGSGMGLPTGPKGRCPRPTVPRRVVEGARGRIARFVDAASHQRPTVLEGDGRVTHSAAIGRGEPAHPSRARVVGFRPQAFLSFNRRPSHEENLPAAERCRGLR